MEQEIHRLLKEIIHLNVLSWGVHVETEMLLKNKKIADIYFQWNRAEYIIEVKTIYKHSLIENALDKYYGQCDFLTVAFPPDEIPSNIGRQKFSWETKLVDRVGLIEVTGTGIKLRKCPQRLQGETARQGRTKGEPSSQ